MSSEAILWRGVFNQWHIGLGGHINVQHYAQAIDEVRRSAALAHGLGPKELQAQGQTLRPVPDRLDFRKELVPGDAAEISAVSGRGGDNLFDLNGAMKTRPEGKTSMRFQTAFAPFDLETRQMCDWASLPDGTIDPLRAMRPMMDPWMPATRPARSRLTWQGTVETRDCDEFGLQSPRAIFDIITRGLWAVQIANGRHRDAMSAKGAAGGVTALQARYGRPARMGDLLQVHTATLGLGSTSVRLGHLITDAVDGAIVARVEYVTAFFGRRTGRKSAPDADYVEALLAMSLT